MSEPKNPGTSGEKRGAQRRPTIVRGRITKINAEKFKDAPISGIELGVEFDSVKANGAFLEIWFTYHATYKEEVGRISMAGVLIFEMDEVTARGIADKFEKEHQFDQAIGENIINSINYKCSTEAILPAKVLDLTAPIVPPRIAMRMNPTQQPGEQKQPPAAQPAQPPKAAQPAPPAQKPAAGKPTADPTRKPGSPFPFNPKTPPPFK